MDPPPGIAPTGGSPRKHGSTENSVLPAMTPSNVRFALRRCLEKNPSRRFRDAADVRIEIEEAHSVGEAASRAKRSWLAWSAAALLFLAAAVLAFVHFREQTPVAEPVRFQIPFPDSVSLGSAGAFAVSPDGRLLAFSASGSDGVYRLWLRALGSFEARPLSGTRTDDVIGFFWSPDGRFIAFSTDG